MKKITKKLIKTFLCLLISTVLFSSSFVTYISLAATTIPDKEDFEKYLEKVYYLEGATDEQKTNAGLDYKDRYIMYVDIDYVRGAVNNARGLDVYYYVNNQKEGASYGNEIPGGGGGGGGGGNQGSGDGGGTTYPPITVTAQEVWDYLIAHGFSEIATAGIMGNMQAESGIKTCCVQGDYLNSNPAQYDQDYTDGVDSGRITREEFVYYGPTNGRDEVNSAKGIGGYGLTQFTWHTYKEQLYDEAKARGVSIADPGVQLDVLYGQIEGYKAAMNSFGTVYDAASYFLIHYENPTNQSDAVKTERARNGRGIYEQILGYPAPDAAGAGSDDIAYFQGELPFEFRDMTYHGNTKVGGSTLKETGAGITALSMVVSNLTYSFDPTDIAGKSEEYMTKNGCKLELLTDVEKYGLKATAIGKDTVRLFEALNDGCVAIAVTGSKEMGGVTGVFNRTSDCNFIVITGTDDDGYLKVHDPDGGNYYNIKNLDVSYQLIKGEAVGGFYIYEPFN